MSWRVSASISATRSSVTCSGVAMRNGLIIRLGHTTHLHVRPDQCTLHLELPFMTSMSDQIRLKDWSPYL